MFDLKQSLPALSGWLFGSVVCKARASLSQLYVLFIEVLIRCSQGHTCASLVKSSHVGFSTFVKLTNWKQYCVLWRTRGSINRLKFIVCLTFLSLWQKTMAKVIYKESIYLRAYLQFQSVSPWLSWWEAEAEGSHVAITKRPRESKPTAVAWLLKLQSPPDSATGPPTRPHLLIFHNWFYQLENRALKHRSLRHDLHFQTTTFHLLAPIGEWLFHYAKCM